MKWALILLVGCQSALDQRLSLIDQPRILAITATPAEAKPGATIDYAIAIAGPDGPIATPPAWAYCIAGKPPTEDNAVARACLGDDALVDLGTAPTATGMLPTDACGTFGPDVPSGSQMLRPRDPDPTGGYYQPIRAREDDLTAFGLSRITCNLPTAPTAVAQAYRTQYVANVAPVIATFELRGDVLAVTWPASSIESYLYYDQSSQQLVTRPETLRASWFATAGTIGEDSTGFVEGESPSELTTTWQPPTTPGPVYFWVVLRDSRGGIAISSRAR